MSSARPIARTQSTVPGTSVVPVEDIEPLRMQMLRLSLAFQCCDDAARIEVLRVAELLAGAAP